MAPIPIITLYQGAGPGTPGVALVGTVGAGVVHCVANTPPTANRWRWSWIGGPPGSSIVRAQGVQDSKTLTTYSFTPDVAGGYLLQLDEFDANGAVGTAYLMFAVLNSGTRLPHIPPMLAFPGFPVPDPFTCMNFVGHQAGWSDFMEQYFAAIDVGGSANATSLQGRALAATAPTDGQAVVWNNGGTTWTPGFASKLGIGVGLAPDIVLTYSVVSWGAADANPIFNQRDALVTADAAVHVLATYAIPDVATTGLDVKVEAFTAAGGASIWNLSIGYVRNGAGPVVLGTTTSADPRGSNGGAPLAATPTPVFAIVGNTVTLSVQNTGGAPTNWASWASAPQALG